MDTRLTSRYFHASDQLPNSDMHFAGPAVMLQALSECGSSHRKVTIVSHISFLA
ncbi:hypothetical protein V8C44DRAFT_321142 [Trichoderma aethiopicum]